MERNQARLQNLFAPSLLERLTDLEPEKKTELYHRAISAEEMRVQVLQNLSFLLNNKSHPKDEELLNDDALKFSVLGMGLPDFCGRYVSVDSREQLQNEILEQVRFFEPRFDPDSVCVNCVERDVSKGKSILEFEISGVIRTDQICEEVIFRSELNFESGKVSLTSKDSRE